MLWSVSDMRMTWQSNSRGPSGQVEHHPVPGHHAPTGSERRPGLHRRDRDSSGFEQVFHRLGPDALPGTGDPARGRKFPVGVPAARHRLQRPCQAPHHAFVVLAGEHRHRGDVVEHHPRRQRPTTSFGCQTMRGDHLVDVVAGDPRGQHTHRHQIGQRHRCRGVRIRLCHNVDRARYRTETRVGHLLAVPIPGNRRSRHYRQVGKWHWTQNQDGEPNHHDHEPNASRGAAALKRGNSCSARMQRELNGVLHIAG